MITTVLFWLCGISVATTGIIWLLDPPQISDEESLSDLPKPWFKISIRHVRRDTPGRKSV